MSTAETSATGSPVQTLTTTRDAGRAHIRSPPRPRCPTGSYTAQAAQGDSAGNTGDEQREHVHVNGPPVVSITSPPATVPCGDNTPRHRRRPRHRCRRPPTVTLKIYAGTTSAAARWKRSPTPAPDHLAGHGAPALADGTYTAQASQADASSTGTSAAVTFRIDSTAPTARDHRAADGLRTNDTTPTIAGTGGIATGDASMVTVKLYAAPQPPARRSRRSHRRRRWRDLDIRRPRRSPRAHTPRRRHSPTTRTPANTGTSPP